MLALNQQTTLSGNNHSTLTHQTYVPFCPLLLILQPTPLRNSYVVVTRKKKKRGHKVINRSQM